MESTLSLFHFCYFPMQRTSSSWLRQLFSWHTAHEPNENVYQQSAGAAVFTLALCSHLIWIFLMCAWNSKCQRGGRWAGMCSETETTKCGLCEVQLQVDTSRKICQRLVSLALSSEFCLFRVCQIEIIWHSTVWILIQKLYWTNVVWRSAKNIENILSISSCKKIRNLWGTRRNFSSTSAAGTSPLVDLSFF